MNTPHMATSLESRTYDMLSDSGLVSPQNMTGTRYVDLGAIPSPSGERNASHMQTDDPPPETSGQSSQSESPDVMSGGLPSLP